MTRAFSFWEGVNLRSQNMSLSFFFRPPIPRGRIQSPSFQRRIVTGNPRLVTVTPSGCLRLSTLAISTKNRVPPTEYTPGPETSTISAASSGPSPSVAAIIDISVREVVAMWVGEWNSRPLKVLPLLISSVKSPITDSLKPYGSNNLNSRYSQ